MVFLKEYVHYILYLFGAKTGHIKNTYIVDYPRDPLYVFNFKIPPPPLVLICQKLKVRVSSWYATLFLRDIQRKIYELSYKNIIKVKEQIISILQADISFIF